MRSQGLRAGGELRIISRTDLLTAVGAAIPSLIVYVWTAAPSVTLLDSGEFLVAGQHFGVPHPTGYPLWTILAWLFSMLPLGNAAWEINVLSGVLGALAVGVVAGLARSAGRWIFSDLPPPVITASALAASWLFAFSFSMWSQAVITEVYTLHALLVGLFLVTLYAWIRTPARPRWLLASFFLLTLAFANHQLALCLAPLPFLAAWVMRRDIFWDLVAAGLFTASAMYLALAGVSADPLVWKAAARFAYFSAALLGAYFFWRGLRQAWLFLALPAAVVLGLLPYAYLPLASSTNPPMNWGYTRDAKGFFNTFNRSQYPGPLTDQSLRVVGRLMGVPSKSDFAPPPARDPYAPPPRTAVERLRIWGGFFFAQLARSFTVPGLLAYLASFALLLRWRERARWLWMASLHAAFLLAAFAQPGLDQAGADISGWWLQMPYHTYTNLFFALLAATGFAAMFRVLARWRPVCRWASLGLLLLPVLPLLSNYSECSQRGRWFGWKFGHDMLKDLPRGSVVLGGTDAGRFVPTYMIFGESGQDDRHKRDPGFDRRDLFILTQNALGEPFYMRYLRDQYTRDRRPVANGFERWLGRGTIYPAETLILPDDQEVAEAIREAAEPDPSTGVPLDTNLSTLPFSAVSHWIWKRNRGEREFFVEESFPMLWTYRYAIPWGLVYKLHPTPLDEIPPEAVERDMAFWRKYHADLLADPLFADDLDARRAFSRLRFTSGSIYRYRQMSHHAEVAFREALALWPADPGASHALIQLLWEREAFDEAKNVCAAALALDPRNESLQGLEKLVAQRSTKQSAIDDLARLHLRNPRNRGALKGLIMLRSSVGEREKANELVLEGYRRFGTNADFLRFAAAHDVINGQPLNSLAPALKLAEIEPENPANLYILANAWYFHTNYPEFFSAMRRAIAAGGVPMREMFSREPMFAPVREHPEFREILQSRPAGSP